MLDNDGIDSLPDTAQCVCVTAKSDMEGGDTDAELCRLSLIYIHYIDLPSLVRRQGEVLGLLMQISG